MTMLETDVLAPRQSGLLTCAAYCALVIPGIAGAQELSPLPLPKPDAQQGEAEDEGIAAERVQVGGERVPDRDIEEMLRAVFAQVDELKDLRVEVRAGVVHLTGTASSTEAERKAVALARRIAGVLYVDNDLTPPQEAQEQIAPALEKVQTRLQAIADKLPVLALAAIVVFMGYVLARLIRGRVVHGASARNPLVRGLYRQVAGAAVVIGSVVLALDLLQATALVSAVLGAAGVLGLTLGLALRDIAENYLSSILLSLRRPFDPSDLVRIGEHEGRVMRLTTRDTTLMTLEGTSVRLPNAMVFKSVIVNYSRNPLRQFHVNVGVDARQSLIEAQRIGLEGLQRTPGIAKEPPAFARVEEFGSSFMELRFFGWVDQRESDWWKVRSEAVRHLKGAFEQAGIDLPPPALRLESPDMGEAAPVERERRPPPSPPTEDLTRQAHEVGQDDHLQRQMNREQAQTEEEDLLCETSESPQSTTARPTGRAGPKS